MRRHAESVLTQVRIQVPGWTLLRALVTPNASVRFFAGRVRTEHVVTVCHINITCHMFTYRMQLAHDLLWREQRVSCRTKYSVGTTAPCLGAASTPPDNLEDLCQWRRSVLRFFGKPGTTRLELYTSTRTRRDCSCCHAFGSGLPVHACHT